MRIRRFCCGWCRLEAEASRAADILDLCRKYGMNCNRSRLLTAKGVFQFEMSAYTTEHFLRLCAEENISVHITARGGLPHLFARYYRRAGLMIGGILGAAILLSSFRVLWDIRISGNEQMTLRQVREELAASGLRVGMPLSQLDPGQMALQIQLDSEHISWVSVNISGTVAYVEIRERVPTPQAEVILPANLVASCEGVVEELEIYRGVPVVQAGQAVGQGELLVSGVYDSQAVGWRVTRAAGRVLARTVHDFTIEIPLEYEEKQYSDAPTVKKTLIFFEKEIKLFKNSGILGTSCDKIDDIDNFIVGEGASLPISLRTETFFPYEYRSVSRTYEQAQAVAYSELERCIVRELSDGTLLRKAITTTLAEDAYRLHCRVWCLENIARQSPFSVELLTQ